MASIGVTNFLAQVFAGICTLGYTLYEDSPLESSTHFQE